MPDVPDEVKWLRPAAVGGRASFYLTSDEDGAGKSLGVYAALEPNVENDPDITGVTVAYTGGGTHRIDVTVPPATTADFEDGDVLYVTVWDDSSGVREPLARVAIPFYRTPGS